MPVVVFAHAGSAVATYREAEQLALRVAVGHCWDFWEVGHRSSRERNSAWSRLMMGLGGNCLWIYGECRLDTVHISELRIVKSEF